MDNYYSFKYKTITCDSEDLQKVLDAHDKGYELISVVSNGTRLLHISMEIPVVLVVFLIH